MTDDQTFADYRNRLNIKDILEDAGYKFYRRDGLRYPAYVALDNEGRRIRGSKFIVMPDKNCCFQPPSIKVYSVTSFIWEHPELFHDYEAGMKESALVHKVCQRLLNISAEQHYTEMHNPITTGKLFDISEYEITHFCPKDFESQKPFYAFFKSRGIDFATRCAFHDSFVLASRTAKDGSTYRNLSFPMYKPGQPDKCVGFEERGYPHKDGTARKGMAAGTNASEGLWIGSPNGTTLKDAQNIYVFESAYDAMAFYQLRMSKNSLLNSKEKQELKSAVYVSTGGNPSYGQILALLKAAPQATFHLGFDRDLAGKQFVSNFENLANKQSPVSPDNVPEDMREFMQSYDRLPKTTKGLLSFDEDDYDLLPDGLRKLYLAYDSAKEEALEYHYSPFLCKEDKQAAADKMHNTWLDFKDAFLDKLHLQDGQDLAPVKVIREEPSEGYKDFNDELLDKKQYALTDVVETAFDENGVDLTFERKEENEKTNERSKSRDDLAQSMPYEEDEAERQTKHHGFKR